jgi:hypothetical protein
VRANSAGCAPNVPESRVQYRPTRPQPKAGVGQLLCGSTPIETKCATHRSNSFRIRSRPVPSQFVPSQPGRLRSACRGSLASLSGKGSPPPAEIPFFVPGVHPFPGAPRPFRPLPTRSCPVPLKSGVSRPDARPDPIPSRLFDVGPWTSNVSGPDPDRGVGHEFRGSSPVKIFVTQPPCFPLVISRHPDPLDPGAQKVRILQ